VTAPVPRLTEGPLTPAQAAAVADLAEAGRQADGVAPLSEHALLHARHPSAGEAADNAGEPAARDFLLASGETVVGYAHLDLAGAEEDLSGELVVHPAHRRRRHATALISALAASAGGRGIRLWAHGDLPAAAGLARATGFTRVRSLWQMRLALAGAGAGPGITEPSFPAGVAMRTFVPGKDEDAWLALNARAFAHHPEQGAWTRADLELREAEPWFDPAGFFLAERGGELVGFHWTKVHTEGPGGVPEGEVYVVGIDPSRQGGGLGRALTVAGLRYLEAHGLAHVMLYVDEENAAATRMYAALGFTRWNTDVMYRRK
jgi:mycothiol synthase